MNQQINESVMTIIIPYTTSSTMNNQIINSILWRLFSFIFFMNNYNVFNNSIRNNISDGYGIRLATLLDTALDLETELGTFTRYGTESKEWDILQRKEGR